MRSQDHVGTMALVKDSRRLSCLVRVEKKFAINSVWANALLREMLLDAMFALTSLRMEDALKSVQNSGKSWSFKRLILIMETPFSLKILVPILKISFSQSHYKKL